MAAADSRTCSTVETPSRLILFFPESTPPSLTTFLPTFPLSKPVRERLVLGRSSAADVRLNDERMSRAYAALWHDGNDPFVFRVSNLSERKLVTVDGAALRFQEEAEVRDGSVLVLDFLEFKAKVSVGDVVACSYEVSFAKNVIMSPVSVKPAGGKCWVLPRRDDGDPPVPSPYRATPCRSPPESCASQAVGPLLTCLRSGSVDSGVGSTVCRAWSHLASRRCCESAGVEYEQADNIVTMSQGCSCAGNEDSSWSPSPPPPPPVNSVRELSLNIPLQRSPPSTVQAEAPHSATKPCSRPRRVSDHQTSPLPPPCRSRNGLSCWLNIRSEPSVPQPQKRKPENDQELSVLAQRLQDKLVFSKQKVCPSCGGCGEGSARPTTLQLGPTAAMEPTLTLTMPDMVPLTSAEGRRSPVEDAEWDTDDPNINSYMG
ncbi:uncharacterized protein LOC143300596 [Babylonia areolata]|uniref:uncharacterized protein LOC143300596 n=1 Tax=Babylonia areolata TaxID=304850 RepID=UPI003FD14C4C